MKKLMLLAALVVIGLVGGWLLSRPSESERVVPRLEIAALPAPTTEPESPAPPLRQHPPRPAPKLIETAPKAERHGPPEDPDEIRKWAMENPAQALAWMSQAPAGEQRDTLAEIVCAQMAETDPAQSVQLAERFGQNCTNLLENLVYQWSERNAAEARTYALEKPPGEERDRLLARVALTCAKENPAEAAQLVVDEIATGEIKNEAVMSVLHQWGLRQPREALAWAELFPEGELRQRALAELRNLLHAPQTSDAGAGM